MQVKLFVLNQLHPKKKQYKPLLNIQGNNSEKLSHDKYMHNYLFFHTTIRNKLFANFLRAGKATIACLMRFNESCER